MTGMFKYTIVTAALLAAIVVVGHARAIPATADPATPFWQLQAASPSARESDDMVAFRTAARAPGEFVVAAR
ncbi:MAG: hypothetical protein U1E40_03885 [Amaricoccus sp.]